MDLSTHFMGLPVRNPFVVGASPLSDDVRAVRNLVDAGASAIVMHSLFMEQLLADQRAHLAHVTSHEGLSAEASSYEAPLDFALGPEAYLEQILRLKGEVDVPVIASLNGTTAGDWTRFAAWMEEAGADGLELNVYYLPLDGAEPPDAVEQRFLDVLTAVREHVRLPISMKLLAFFSSPIHTAKRLEAAGANGFVLFNRLFPADIDIEQLELRPALHLSDRSLLGLRLLWIAALYGQVKAPISASGGVFDSGDVARALLAGASTVQMTSALLEHGPERLVEIRRGLGRWMEDLGYGAVSEVIGAMSRARCPDPEAWERGNYLRVLQQWRPR